MIADIIERDHVDTTVGLHAVIASLDHELYMCSHAVQSTYYIILGILK